MQSRPTKVIHFFITFRVSDRSLFRFRNITRMNADALFVVGRMHLSYETKSVPNDETDSSTVASNRVSKKGICNDGRP